MIKDDQSEKIIETEMSQDVTSEMIEAHALTRITTDRRYLIRRVESKGIRRVEAYFPRLDESNLSSLQKKPSRREKRYEYWASTRTSQTQTFTSSSQPKVPCKSV